MKKKASSCQVALNTFYHCCLHQVYFYCPLKVGGSMILSQNAFCNVCNISHILFTFLQLSIKYLGINTMESLTAQEENKMIWTTNIQPSRTKGHLYLPVNHAAEISKLYTMIQVL